MVCNGYLIAPICQNIDLAISRGPNCPPMGSLRFGKVLRESVAKLTVNYRDHHTHTNSSWVAGHE